MMTEMLAKELDENGIVRLPDLLTKEQLGRMQEAFSARLRRLRWNNVDGYEKTELYRHMVQDVLLLDQGFLDVALHPIVKQILGRYLGNRYQLVEAKGWKSLPTKKDFHGWHGDAWYDQGMVQDIPREVKLVVYLTNVTSGAFNYIKGTHRKQVPRPVRNDEVKDVPQSAIVQVLGPAGSACIFDTSGIHRQGVPMLEARQAVFYCYHNPDIPLQKEDAEYNRYHPLLLNAAFLGNLSEEDKRILGFGNKAGYIPAFERRSKPAVSQQMLQVLHDAELRVANLMHLVRRVSRRLKRIVSTTHT